MKIGYVNGIAGELEVLPDRTALSDIGCDLIFEDRGAASGETGPGLLKAMAEVTTGDTLVVVRLNRLGRSARDVAAIVSRLKIVGANLCALDDGIDTGASGGQQTANAILALGALEGGTHARIVRAGMKAAKERGKTFGRQERMSADQIAQAQRLMREDGMSYSEAARALRLPVSTVWKTLRRKQYAACIKDPDEPAVP